MKNKAGKKHIIVIADDITGAAEIAGIAFQHGLPVRLLCSSLSITNPKDVVARETEVTVIATDTRSMTEAEAVVETRRIVSSLKLINQKNFSKQGRSVGVILFKKTDSALRGHVVAELEVLLHETSYEHALYLPANPSKGRIIKDGIYYIGDKPIAETDFSFDPEFPAVSSKMAERFPFCEEKNIFWHDVTSEEDIQQAIAQADDRTLFAGAADLFTTLLSNREGLGGQSVWRKEEEDGEKEGIFKPHGSALIVCGSTQSKPLNLGIPVCPMPLEVYDQQTDAEGWITSLIEQLRPSSSPSLNREGRGGSSHSLILTIPYRHRTGKEVAIYLRETMGEVIRRLVAVYPPQELIIEGGSTAWQILQQLGWHEFDITDEIAPGVVRMLAVGTHTHATMKPGSYPWTIFR